ncbi:MAG: hypothetical protein ACRENI_01775 [Gemmatimonadaceae bacterium]
MARPPRHLTPSAPIPPIVAMPITASLAPERGSPARSEKASPHARYDTPDWLLAPVPRRPSRARSRALLLLASMALSGAGGWELQRRFAEEVGLAAVLLESLLGTPMVVTNASALGTVGEGGGGGPGPGQPRKDGSGPSMQSSPAIASQSPATAPGTASAAAARTDSSSSGSTASESTDATSAAARDTTAAAAAPGKGSAPQRTSAGSPAESVQPAAVQQTTPTGIDIDSVSRSIGARTRALVDSALGIPAPTPPPFTP